MEGRLGLVVRSGIQDHSQVSNLSAGDAPWGRVIGGRTGLQRKTSSQF